MWIWLSWALFGSGLVFLLWKVYRPLVLAAPALPELPATPSVSTPPAWLYCEEGAQLDVRARWFPLRSGGKTVIGHRPRAGTSEVAYVYLTADDILEEHVQVRFNEQTKRYEAEPLGRGAVFHNNEEVAAGIRTPLAEGDTLDLGRISRFRFTLSGPDEAD
jgi:hypothetical protein